jgi:hypothetical protein
MARQSKAAAIIQPVTQQYVSASRVGKRSLTTHIDQAAFVQFRQMAPELGKSGEALLNEAINDLFIKYGKRAIA